MGNEWISITTKRPEHGSKVSVRWNDNTETDNIWTGYDPNEEILPIAWKYRTPEWEPSSKQGDEETFAIGLLNYLLQERYLFPFDNYTSTERKYLSSQDLIAKYKDSLRLK